MFMYNAINYGYAGFDDNDIDYSYRSLLNMEKENAFGFMVNISPYFVFKFPYFVLLNNSEFNYIYAGEKKYYYEPRTSILHKQSEFEFMNEIFLLANINPLYVGGYYGATYLINSKILAHKLGIAGIIYFNFLENRLKLNVLVSAGLNVKLPYYNSLTFIEAKASLIYRIL